MYMKDFTLKQQTPRAQNLINKEQDSSSAGNYVATVQGNDMISDFSSQLDLLLALTK